MNAPWTFPDSTYLKVPVPGAGTLLSVPVLRPFRALRYAPAAGPLGHLLAFGEPPPDDVPLHAAHLANPPSAREDRSKFVAFARAMASLAAWRRDGMLILDAEPALYGWPGEGLWVGLARLEDLPKPDAPRTETERLLRRLEATRLHMEFPLFQAAVAPGGVASPLGDGFARLAPDEPWVSELELLGGEAALLAAQRHRQNLGERARGKGAEWIPILASTRTLDPISGSSLPKADRFGNHGTGKEHDRSASGRMEESLGIGWFYWSYGDFDDEGAPCG